MGSPYKKYRVITYKKAGDWSFGRDYEINNRCDTYSEALKYLEYRYRNYCHNYETVIISRDECGPYELIGVKDLHSRIKYHVTYLFPNLPAMQASEILWKFTFNTYNEAWEYLQKHPNHGLPGVILASLGPSGEWFLVVNE